jgi:hypothetical protein
MAAANESDSERRSELKVKIQKSKFKKFVSRSLFHAKTQRKRKDAKGNSFASLRFLCVFA